MFISEIKELQNRLDKLYVMLEDANDTAQNTESTIPEYNACEDAKYYANTTACYIDDILEELEDLQSIISNNELSKVKE